MNSSFLLTNQQQLDRNTYLIPNQLNIKAIKLKSAIINYTELNVVGHQARLSVSSVGTHTPPATFEVFNIPDGAYTPEQYAAKLQDVLNKVRRDEDDVSLTVTTENLYKPPVTWEIKYNEPSQKFEFWAYHELGYEYNVYLRFNEPAADYVGQPFGTWMEFERYGINTHYNTTTNKALTLPRYYRVCSNNLSQFGYSYDSSLGSNIIAIVPIDHSKRWTVYDNNDNFFHFRENNDLQLNTMMNLEIYLEEATVPVTNPEFTITFQIQT